MITIVIFLLPRKKNEKFKSVELVLFLNVYSKIETEPENFSLFTLAFSKINIVALFCAFYHGKFQSFSKLLSQLKLACNEV